MAPGPGLLDLAGHAQQQIFPAPGRDALHTRRQAAMVDRPGHRHRRHAGEVGQLGKRGAVQVVERQLFHQTAAAQQSAQAKAQNQAQCGLLPGWGSEFLDPRRRLRAGRREVRIETREQRAQPIGAFQHVRDSAYVPAGR